MKSGSEGLFTLFTGPDAHCTLQRVNEDLPVTDSPRSSRFSDGLDHRVDPFVGNGDFDLEFGKKINHILRPPVKLGVALLAAEAAYFGDRHALDTGLGQRIANVVEFKWLDDRSYHFHRPNFNRSLSREQRMIELKTIDDLARRLGEAMPPGLSAAREDLETHFRAVLTNAFERMDLVTRDQFEAQSAVLERCRMKLDQLEKQLEDITGADKDG